MQPDFYNILHSLEAKKAGNSDIKLLFQLMYNIAREYFRRSNKNFLLNSVILPEDAAMETVTPLFMGYGDEKCEKLVSAFNKWRPVVQNHTDALFFIHQLLYIRCEHYLVNALKRDHPEISAFVGYLNQNIKDKGYHKQNYLGTVFIVNSEQIIPGSNLITSEEFMLISESLFQKRKLLLDNLFLYLKQNDYFPAIPYYFIIERIKGMNSRSGAGGLLDESLTGQISIDEAADAGLCICLRKLKESYTSKEKLTNAESSAFENALKDIRYDLTDGGISGGYYDYLYKYLPGTDHKQFKIKYENIFEYLVKILKESTVKVLKEND